MEFLAFFVILIVFGAVVWAVAARRRHTDPDVPREDHPAPDATRTRRD